MVEADWDIDEGARRFGRRAHDPVEADDPAELPDVAAAQAEGWFPAPEAPLWSYLPAIWPRHARAWVRDARVRHMVRVRTDGRTERLPWAAADHAEIEAETNRFLAELGVPPRPAGRIWLLRVPEGSADLQSVLDDIWTHWTEAGGPSMATPELVAFADARLRELFA